MDEPERPSRLEVEVALFGETMLRLSAPAREGAESSLEDSETLQVHVGGSESNTAVGLAKLGHTATWISRLTKNPFGNRIASEIREHSVDTSRVIWTDEDRVGTYFFQPGTRSQLAQVWYDRANSAFSCCTPDAIDGALQKLQARIFHTTGISICVSEPAFESTFEAIRQMHQRGSMISFDVNYRSKLMDAEGARLRIEQVLPYCGIVFVPLRDARNLFNVNATTSSAAAIELGQALPNTHLVVTDGVQGSSCRSSSGTLVSQPAYECRHVERLGLGDAFSAGFLSAWLVQEDVEFALRRAALMASNKFETAGDFPLATAEQIELEETSSSRKPIRAGGPSETIHR